MISYPPLSVPLSATFSFTPLILFSSVIAYPLSLALPLLLCLIFSRSSFLPLTTSFLALPHLLHLLLLPFVLHLLPNLSLPFYLLPSFFVSSSPALPLFLLYLHPSFSTSFSPSQSPPFLHYLLCLYLMFFVLLYLLHILFYSSTSPFSTFYFSS